jgi:hypothetical protein
MASKALYYFKLISNTHKATAGTATSAFKKQLRVAFAATTERFHYMTLMGSYML